MSTAAEMESSLIILNVNTSLQTQTIYLIFQSGPVLL